ncbi:MAG: pseudouridine-5'-phosphate glycosidase [Alphaproteobacteria bacterium]|nr:pseudouridine-5'-phosphate glycosidase [Alphaproteobacteria bacterium]
MPPTPSPLAVSPEIAEALADGRAVVALESTILAHGMPYPRNVETAQRCEAIAREAGAVPATIAVLEGRLRIGLTASEIEAIGRGGKDVAKVSRADLAAILASGAPGATTVAATMLGAHLAGIRVFATGGIGGVHRGAETSWDVSADLEELGRTPVAVVCAGAKAILDLPKTLEVLETKGVPVIGYGADAFPAFWSRASGLKAPLRCDDAGAVARVLQAQQALGLSAGAVIANPIPESAEIPAAELAPAIEAACAVAQRSGIVGKAVTPFLLDRVLALTGGRSLAANIALIENNVRVAVEIAVACSKLRQPNV